MNVALSLLLLTAPPVVLVPAGGDGPTCEARARIARAVALNPELRLARAPEADLPDARADLVLDAKAKGAAVTLTARHQGRTKTKSGPLAAALEAVWPKDLPRPEAAVRSQGANPEALAAACKNDAADAYAAAGEAISEVVSDLAVPPATLRRGTVLERWAWARRQRESKAGCRAAAGTLREVVATLERGYLPPIWRRPPRDEARPSAITRVPGAWVLFEDGRFTAVDPDSGAPLWSRRALGAEPRPVAVEDGRIAIVHAKGVTLLETATGTAAWHAALPAPSGELAVLRGRIVVSAGNEVVALDARTAKVRWRFDGLSSPSAGPVEVRGELVAPLYSRLEVLDPEGGTSLRKIELGDEITAPLVPTDDGVWVAIGAQDIALVDVRAAKVRYRTDQAFGAEWPPALVAGQAFVVEHPPRGIASLTLIDPDRAKPREIAVRGLGAPVLGLADFSGVVHPLSRPPAIVARDIAGKERWRARQPGAVRALSAPGDLIVAGVGRRVVVLDRKQGRPLWQTHLEAEVIDVRYDQDGGVVALDNGALYGLPGGRDPRIAARLRRARLDLAACQADLRQFSAAEAMVDKVLARAPTDVEARLARARLRDARKKPDAVAAWFTAHAGTRDGDPARKEIHAALERIAAVHSRAVPPRAPDALLSIEGPAVVVRRGTRTEVLDPKTGAPTARPPGSEIRLDQEARALVRTEANAVKWRLELDDPALVRADIGRRLVVLTATTPEGRALVVDAASGARRWMRPLETPLTRAWPSDEAVLVETGDGALWGIDGATGARRFRKPKPAEGFEVKALSDGWLIIEGARISRIDAKGQRRFAVRVPAGARGYAIAADHLFSWSAKGLVALELGRGRRAGELTDLDVKDVVVAEDLGVALLEDGALVTFDPKRGLQP